MTNNVVHLPPHKQREIEQRMQSGVANAKDACSNEFALEYVDGSNWESQLADLLARMHEFLERHSNLSNDTFLYPSWTCGQIFPHVYMKLRHQYSQYTGVTLSARNVTTDVFGLLYPSR
jgi:hypothetical protein